MGADTTATPTANAADAAIAYARAQLGKPYVWGATGPNGFDCSGLVQAAYKSAGVNLPRTTYQQILSGSLVSKADLQPGDLVFPDIGHVQIYTGGGNIIESPKPGAVVVERPMWGYFSARRVTAPGSSTSSGTGTTGSGASSSSGGGIAGFAASTVKGLTNLVNPTSWASDAQTIALKVAVVGAGLALVLIGATKLAAPAVTNTLGSLT